MLCSLQIEPSFITISHTTIHGKRPIILHELINFHFSATIWFKATHVNTLTLKSFYIVLDPRLSSTLANILNPLGFQMGNFSLRTIVGAKHRNDLSTLEKVNRLCATSIIQWV